MNLLTESGAPDSALSRLTVLIFSFEYPPKAGAGVHVFELARGLSRNGCDVAIVAPTVGSVRIPSEPHLKVHLVEPSAATCARVSQLSRVQGVLALHDDLVSRARRLIVEEGSKPDVIHCHDWYAYQPARTIGQMFDIPVIGTVHSTSEPIVRWWGELPDEEVLEQEAALYRNADALIMVSRSMRDIIKGVYGLSDDRMHVVHNGFDADLFLTPRLNSEEINKLRQTIAGPYEKIIIYAGRLTPQKGIGALLASAARVTRNHPKVCYLIVGEPDSLQSSLMIKQLLGQYPQLRNNVKMLGRVTRKKLSLLYQVADVAVIPSIYEPFGYAAIEAMAAEIPVVATAVGGLVEIIEHDKSGLLVCVHPDDVGPHQVDVKELAAMQIALLDDPSLTKRIAAAGRNRALNEFSLTKMFHATTEVYRQTVSRSHHRSCLAIG